MGAPTTEPVIALDDKTADTVIWALRVAHNVANKTLVSVLIDWSEGDNQANPEYYRQKLRDIDAALLTLGCEI